MISISHKPSFFSTHLLEKTFSRLSAFGLQLFTEICVFAPNVFYGFSVKENVVRANCNIYDTSINSENSVSRMFGRVFSENYMQEKVFFLTSYFRVELLTSQLTYS